MAKQVSEIEKRRQEMRSFLSDNLVDVHSSTLNSWSLPQSVVLYAPYEYKDYKELLDFSFASSDYSWMNYQNELRSLEERTLHFIELQNKKGIVPGFVFLGAETNWEKTGRTDRKGERVNSSGAGKQLLGNKWRKIFFDEKYLRFDEIALREVMRHAKNPVRIYRPGKGTYESELTYYRSPVGDAQSGNLVVVSYIDDKEVHKFDNVPRCPNIQCARPFPENYKDHSGCKHTTNYRNYAIERSNVTEIKKMKRIAKLEEHIQFSPELLHVNGKELYVATPVR